MTDLLSLVRNRLAELESEAATLRQFQAGEVSDELRAKMAAGLLARPDSDPAKEKLESFLAGLDDRPGAQPSPPVNDTASPVPEGTPVESPPQASLGRAVEYVTGGVNCVRLDYSPAPPPDSVVHTKPAEPIVPPEPPSEAMQVEELKLALRRRVRWLKRGEPPRWDYPPSIEKLIHRDHYNQALNEHEVLRQVIRTKQPWESVLDFASRIKAGNRAAEALRLPSIPQPGKWAQVNGASLAGPWHAQAKAEREAQAASRAYESAYRRANGDRTHVHTFKDD